MYLTVNEFLKNNAWWIALSAVALIVIVVLLIILTGKKTKKVTNNDLYNEYIDAFGTINNIISSHFKGSRLTLVLRDYDLLNNEKLETLGISSSIRMSSKITFVSDKSEELSNYINSELTRLSNED